MSVIFKDKPASKQLLSLYCYIGEAVCAAQYVEDALSHAITLKKDAKWPNNITKAGANQFIEKYRSNTLGKALAIVEKENLYHDSLTQELRLFFPIKNTLYEITHYILTLKD